jgi:hypothetical protein
MRGNVSKMTKTLYYNNKRITQKELSQTLGQEKFEKVMQEAIEDCNKEIARNPDFQFTEREKTNHFLAMGRAMKVKGIKLPFSYLVSGGIMKVVFSNIIIDYKEVCQ